MPHVDNERISARTLGSYWRKANTTQRERFTNEFRLLLVRTLAAAVSQVTDALCPDFSQCTDVADRIDAAITYLPISGRHESNMKVRASVRLPRSRSRNVMGAHREWIVIHIEYRMHRHNGSWKIYDIALDGLSLVSSFRASFKAKIKEGGMDGLIEHLVVANKRKVKISSNDTSLYKLGFSRLCCR